MKRFLRTLCFGFAATLVAATSFAEGRDVTAKYLRNVDMEQGVKYWAIEGNQPLGKNTKKVEMVVGFHGMYQGVAEAWKSYRHYIDEVTYEFEHLDNSVMMQRIPNLPNGTYVFGAYVGASHQNARNWREDVLWSNRETIYGVSLYANENEVSVATDNPDWGGIVKWAHSSKFNVATKVTNGRLEVGLRVENTNANYVVWDNVTLYYFGDMSEAEALDAMAEIDMAKAVEVASTLLDVKMNVDTLAFLNYSIEQASQVTTTAATLWDDNEELYWAIGQARSSAVDYERLLADIKAACVVANGVWSELNAPYVDILNEVIGEAYEAYDKAYLNRAELAAMRKALSWSAGDVKYDSLFIACDALSTFIEEARDVEGVPGGYTTMQIQDLMNFRQELQDTMIAYEEDAELDMEERTIDPNSLYPYIAQVYATIENVKNNPISSEYTNMPIKLNQGENGWIEGAEWFDQSKKIVAYTSPLYRFQSKISNFRITVEKSRNGQRYFCLSELQFFDGNGQPIYLTENDITSNADHNTLNDSPDGGGIPALFDEDYDTYFHSAWQNMPAEAHYLEVNLPNGGYDAFSFRMLSRSNSNGWDQSHTFPGEIMISLPAPKREALEALINKAKEYNAYSFPEVGYYIADHSYLTDAIAAAEVLVKNYGSEDECAAMTATLKVAMARFEASEEKAIRLPEAGKAYRIVSAFPNFYEKQGVEKTITVNDSILWWEDVQTDKRLQEFVFEPLLDEDGEPYIEIEHIENWDGTVDAEVYYCYYVKNVATGLYMSYEDYNSFVLSEEPADMVRLKWLGRGQWNILINNYNEEFDSYDTATLHAGDHNSGNMGANSMYGGIYGVSSAIVSWVSGIDTPSAWTICEISELPLTMLVERGDYKSEYIHFESADVIKLTADNECAFENLVLYDLYGNEISIDNLTIAGNTATIRQEKKLVGCAFAFTNYEGVSSVVIDVNTASDALEVLRVVYEYGLALDPQVGTDVMQYADISAYTVAMARAEAMLATGASDEEVRAMTAELDEAIVGLVPNMPVPGRKYYIVSAMDAFVDNHGIGMMIYDDAEYGLRWTYENLYDLNRCWEFVPAEGEEGYYLKNAGTGMYMGTGYGISSSIQMVGDIYETSPYVISSLGSDVVAIASNTNETSRLHAAGHANGAGKAGGIVYWYAGAGTASAWRICEAEAYGLQAFNNYEMKSQDVETKSSSIVNLPIEMVNAVAVTAFQFDLYLPDGVSVATMVEDGEVLYNITFNGERAKSSHVLAAEPQADGALRIVAYSYENAAFIGNDGVLVNVALAVEDIAEGNYEVEMRNVRMVLADGSEKLVSDHTSILTVMNVLQGDVNGDGQYTMSDVVMMVNAVLQKPQANFDADVADMNGDGVITMGDVVNVLRLVLTGDRAMAPVRIASAGELIMPELSVGEFAVMGNGHVALPVALVNSEEYSAFQLDVVLPAGVELSEVTLTGRAKASHVVAWNTLSDGTVRVVAYAMNNAAFRGNEGTLINLVLKTSDNLSADAVLTLTDGLFATVNGAEHQASDVNVMMRSDATGIDGVYSAFRVYGVEGAVVVECGAETTVSIYAAAGQLVQQMAVKAGKHVVALPAGVYVINGNKVIVK